MSRNARRRRRRRNRSIPIPVTMLCVLLTLVGVVIAVSVFFKIRTVLVVGETRYDPAELAEASGIRPGDNMLFFNKFASIEQMFADHPYLHDITIRRHLPDEIEITVSDCVPIAVLKTDTGCWLIDGDGKLLERCSAPPENLLPIVGIELTEPKLGEKGVFSQQEKEKSLFLLLNSLREDGIIEEIAEVDFTQSYHISFACFGRFTVRIGTTEELAQKLRYVHVIVEDKLAPNQTGVIDVSDPGTARFIP